MIIGCHYALIINIMRKQKELSMIPFRMKICLFEYVIHATKLSMVHSQNFGIIKQIDLCNDGIY